MKICVVKLKMNDCVTNSLLYECTHKIVESDNFHDKLEK